MVVVEEGSQDCLVQPIVPVPLATEGAEGLKTAVDQEGSIITAIPMEAMGALVMEAMVEEIRQVEEVEEGTLGVGEAVGLVVAVDRATQAGQLASTPKRIGRGTDFLGYAYRLEIPYQPQPQVRKSVWRQYCGVSTNKFFISSGFAF